MTTSFFSFVRVDLGVRSFGMIRKRITDPRSLGSRCVRATDKSTLGKDFSVPLKQHDPSDLRLVILFRIPNECTPRQSSKRTVFFSVFASSLLPKNVVNSFQKNLCYALCINIFLCPYLVLRQYMAAEVFLAVFLFKSCWEKW